MEALEAVIQYLKGAGLSTTQIASKKHYGDGWEVKSPAVVVALDGGDRNLYSILYRARMEMRCYASSDFEAVKLMSAVENACRAAERVKQAVSGGTALIYRINPVSGKSVLYDEDIQMDFSLQFFEAAISVSSL